MKRRIKLTESELRNIIAESIKNVICELDARTYASYANKRRQQAQQANNFSDKMKYTNKAEDGEEAARNAWNKKYAYDEQLPNNGYNKQMMYPSSDSPYTNHQQSFSQSTPYTAAHNNVNTMNKGTDDASMVAKQMRDNSGTYVNGKGWQ